jgi:hypothetical protein
MVFVTVMMLSNPGVDVPLSHMPTLALVIGSLALVVSRLAAAGRTAPALARPASVCVHNEMTPPC